MDLVEREAALESLRQALRGATSHGRIALVSGEAGVGKTSLLRALAGAHQPVWWGACDALQTPHPLAPLLDIAREGMAKENGTRFAAQLDGPRPALFDAVVAALAGSQFASPTLVVIEDAHWADDATLDLLKFLGRRIERTRALLVISFRDDEVSAAHPLRQVVGELPGAALTRIDLARLSSAGVATLARRALRAPAGLFDATLGNPFFVTELLRHPEDELPRSVQDLVLARYSRLDKPAQAIVRLAALVPGRIERWLLDSLLAARLSDLETCLDSGLLFADATTLSFRHELARRAVESALSAPVAQTLHAQLLKGLADSGRAIASARLAHHAALARDEAAVRRYAPVAGAEALERGAHREAVRHYRSALEQGGRAADVANDNEREGWLEAYAQACRRIDALAEAGAAREELGALYARRGDTMNEGRNLSRLALVHVNMMRNAQADAESRQAISLLERLPPSLALADAYEAEASLRMLNRDCEESILWSNKAIELLRELGDQARLCDALSVLGTAMMFIDFHAGCRQMEEALALAMAENSSTAAAVAMLNLGSAAGELMQLTVAERWLRRAIDFAGERELDAFRNYSNAWLALCELQTGRWADAAARAAELVDRGGSSAIVRVMALVALGRVRTRRGDTNAQEVLDEALPLAGGSQTLQRIAPVRAARAEAAYARGDLVAVATEAQDALALAQRHRHAWFIGELAVWCWRAGVLDSAPAGCAEPYALQIDGQWRGAATAWAQLGCPFEQARALADGDAQAQQEAISIFELLGARPAADRLRRQLREAGVRGVVRGARESTRAQPHGLTTRELQVLALLCEGLRNAEIAQRLSRSVRTVDHHVAAVFAKLGVDSRVAAIQAAQRAGLAPAQIGQAPAPN